MLTIFLILFLLFALTGSACLWCGRRTAEDDRRAHKLDHVLEGVHRLVHQMEVVIMATAELKAVLARIDTATNNIAEDIRVLKEKILTGMTAAQVAEVQAEAEAVAVKLEGIAASTDDPVPGEPA